MSFADKMLDMLTSSYDRSDAYRIKEGKLPETNIGKVMYLAGWGFDIIKEHTEKVMLWDNIDSAQGKTLERIGKNYGVLRGGAPDKIYRIMIKVKLIAMLSAGDIETILQSAAVLFNVDLQSIKIEEVCPAKVYIYIDEDQLDDEHKDIAVAIARLMKRIVAAGVGMRIFYKTYHSGKLKVFVGTTGKEIIKIRITPVAADKYIEQEIPIQIGIPALNFVKIKYGAEKERMRNDRNVNN